MTVNVITSMLIYFENIGLALKSQLAKNNDAAAYTNPTRNSSLGCLSALFGFKSISNIYTSDFTSIKTFLELMFQKPYIFAILDQVMNFEEVCKAIKEVRIQGATNVAKAATKALLLKHDSKSVQKLLSLRPTEPTLRNAIHHALSFNDLNEGVKETLRYFDDANDKIAKIGASKIKSGMNVFVHCHSHTLIRVLIEAKRQGKKFTVHSTETRPLYQGRTTATDIAKAGIPVVYYIDSAARIALKQCDIALLGADAITLNKVYNKIGSEMFAIIMKDYKIPLYICSDAWKFSPHEEVVEERSPDEVWASPPKGVKIENPSFEKINPALIKEVISELGSLRHKEFLKKVRKAYSFIK